MGQQENQVITKQAIIAKAWEDEAFKKELLANPAEAIQNLAGEELTFKGDIIVNDQTDSSVLYINIPPNPENMELTEEELEAVAGGGDITINIICRPKEKKNEDNA